MNFIAKQKRKRLLRKIKSIILHAPEKRVGLWQIGDNFCCIYKATEDKVWLTELDPNVSLTEFNKAYETPFAAVELSGNVERDVYLVEQRLIFKNYYDRYKQEYFDSILNYLNDDNQINLITADTYGTICVIKRDDGYIDIGYIDTLSLQCNVEMPMIVTRTVPLEQDRDKTTNFILDEIEQILFFKFNPTTGEIPNE